MFTLPAHRRKQDETEQDDARVDEAPVATEASARILVRTAGAHQAERLEVEALGHLEDALGRGTDGDRVHRPRVRRGQEAVDECHGAPLALQGQRFCRSSTRRIFPLTVLGSSVTKEISRGYLYGAVVRFTCSWSSVASASEPATLALRTTKALMRWPSFSSGTPTTADSATAGCSRSADSTSNGPTR